jgi:hypothetical protein
MVPREATFATHVSSLVQAKAAGVQKELAKCVYKACLPAADILKSLHTEELAKLLVWRLFGISVAFYATDCKLVPSS